MAMMMGRRPGGACMCKLCVPPKYRGHPGIRGSYRATENRTWREDVRDLPQGESWLDFMLDNASFGGVPAARLSYWEAMDCLEEIHEGYPTPPGFDGAWSTESGDVSYG